MTCGRCLLQPGPFERVTAAVDYAFPWALWALALKSEQNMALARPMAHFMSSEWQKVREDYPLRRWIWTAVPLHPLKLMQRGFNPAWQLAKACHAMCEQDGDTLAPTLLQRRHWQVDQHTLPHHRRQQAVKNAFALAPGALHAEPDRDHAVLIVDDVMTTGATLHACAEAIRRHWDLPIHALVFARTPARNR